MSLYELAPAFTLPWSAYVRLLLAPGSVPNPEDVVTPSDAITHTYAPEFLDLIFRRKPRWTGGFG